MGNRLYVGNLSFNVTTEAVREWFASCGTVTDVHVVTDRETGRSRGFAFVTMGTDAEAQKAIAETNGALLDGRPLRVNEAEARPSRGSGIRFGGGVAGGGGVGGGGGSERNGFDDDEYATGVWAAGRRGPGGRRSAVVRRRGGRRW